MGFSNTPYIRTYLCLLVMELCFKMGTKFEKSCFLLVSNVFMHIFHDFTQLSNLKRMEKLCERILLNI